MEKQFIPLNDKQEEAVCELYHRLGIWGAQAIVMKYIEENLGKVHKHTIAIRKILNELEEKVDNKARLLVEESGLQEVLIQRLIQSENK